MRNRFVGLFLSVVFAISANAAEPSPAGYERVLLPVYAPTVRIGAYGSLWMTELFVRNDSSAPAQIFEFECAFFCTCVGTECEPPGGTPPGGYYTPVTSPNVIDLANVGLLLYIDRRLSADVVVNLRVRDVSRHAESFGTEVPVVREQSFHTTNPLRLLGIPVTTGYRQHLRLYGISSRSGQGHVRVQVFDQRDEEMLAESFVTLIPSVGAQINPDHERYGYPAYAEIPLLASLLPATFDGDRIRIQVASVSEGLTFWGMVSVTNNVTQQVTLVTPQ